MALRRLSQIKLRNGSTVHSEADYTYEDDTSRLWKVDQGDHRATYSYADTEGHPGLVKTLAFTEDSAACLTTAQGL